jgi:hypothetical protein
MTETRPGRARPAAGLLCLLAATAVAGPAAYAQTAAPAAPAPATPASATTPEKPAEAPAAPVSWQDGIKLNAQLDAGFTLNPDRPRDGLNFGQLFTDRANQFLVNQVLLTAQRALDPKATGYDVGFKVQLLYGTDARFVQFLGEFNNLTNDRYQLAVVEANVAVHLPWLTDGGIDLKAGQFATPLGYETIDPSTNPFYSHSYIFSFGLPFDHTGVLTVTHVNPVLDVYLGIDSGVDTTLGSGDNNSSPGGIFGGQLTLGGGNVTILGLTHLGPENSYRVGPGADTTMRYENDIVLTWKANDKLTLVTELNLIRDDFAKATGFGAAQYVSYALTDQLTLNGRAEFWRDDKGFYVTGYRRGRDYVQAEYGYPTAIARPQGTYSEFTVGLTYKPTVPAPIANLMIRPEVRYDQALSGFSPYGAGRNRGQFTAAADVILGF